MRTGVLIIMKMKLFTTIKVGYTAGTLGNTGEYFTTIIVSDEGIESFSHYGQYGSEDRVNNALKEKGYKQSYVPSDYGKLVKRDINYNLFKREYEALAFIKENF